MRNEAKFIGSSLNSFSRQGDVNDDDLYVRRGLELAGGEFIDENDGRRLCFEWRDDAVWEVEFVDYHKG